MPSRVTIQVNKGQKSGEKFVYENKESVVVGRQQDSNIALPENTVSRYHCMMEILPPKVMVRDFKSLNGTYLNGTLIGQREEGMSAEQAREAADSTEFEMKEGDRLGLGKDCELVLSVFIPQNCAECGVDLPEGEETNFKNDKGYNICANCFKEIEERKAEEARRAEEARLAAEKAERERKEAERIAAEMKAKEQAAKDAAAREKAERERKEAERIAAEMLEKQKAEEKKRQDEERRRKEEQAKRDAEKKQQAQRRCEICGTPITGGANVPNICPNCQRDPMKVLEFLLMEAMRGQGDAKEIQGYKKINRLGQGGMGEVWRVEEEATGKQMALKLMLPQVQTDAKARNMFMREAYIAQQLVHPNVVRQFTSGNSGDTFFMLLELCEGGSVDDLMKKMGGRLPLDTATHIILQALSGLDYAHNAQVEVKLKNGEIVKANGVVHRDFKTGNIFLMDHSTKPVAKVADFGLAKAFETAGLTDQTRTGELAGTPAFMPRQQVLNYRYAKPDVDVWAAAAAYYFMLTGLPPKDLARGGDIWKIALTSAAVPIRKRDSGVPKKLAAVIDEALIEKPKIGISTAAELKRKIEDAL